MEKTNKKDKKKTTSVARSKGFYIVIIGLAILIGMIGLNYAASVYSNNPASYQNMDNVTVNNSGIQYNGNKAFARTADVVVCRGTSVVDDLLKQFTCDVVCKSTDSNCADELNGVIASDKRIYLAAGTYNISNTIGSTNIYRFTLQGEGPSTIIQVNNNTNINLVSFVSSELIDISSLMLDGNKYNQISGQTGLSFTNVNNSNANLIIARTYGDGFAIQNGFGNSFNIKAIDIGKQGTNDGDGIVIRSSNNQGKVDVDGASGDGVIIKGSNNNVRGLVIDKDIHLEFPKVTRIELIGPEGRIVIQKDSKEVDASIQDNGRTLKVFYKK